MKILLTSDWQAQFSNLDACKRAHQQELDIISKYKIDTHIDLGDLKNDFNPVDINVVKFQQERKEAIHNAVTYDITLMGNHDMLGQYDAGKNWFSLFDSISGNNVAKPQVLRLGNCIFSCLPFDRSNKVLAAAAKDLYKEQLATQRKNPNQRAILLFHCDVNRAKYSHVTSKKSEAKITLQHLHTSFYDRCFGGHIHLRQKLSKNTMYVGNPFACDAGEIDQEKGFILYDDAADKVSFIHSVVPGIFSWNYVKEHKPKLLPGTQIKAVVDCSVKENYHKELERVVASIEHKYPECISYVVPAFRADGAERSIEIDPNSDDESKLKKYVQLTVTEDLRSKRKAIRAYLSSILAMATSSGFRSSGKLIFDSIKAINVLSYRKVDFSFRNLGVCLIKGNNKDSWMSSNGSGKTNLLSLLPVATHGKTFKGQQSDEWANDKNKDKAIVHLSLLDEKKRRIEIIRGRRPVRLKLLINGEDESTGRRHVGKKETQGLIEETLGYTFDTLSNAVYIDQSLTNAFLSGTEKTRAALIHQFQNMDRFKVARDLISKDLSKLLSYTREIETEKDVSIALLKQLVLDIDKARTKREEDLAVHKKQKQDSLANYRTLKVAFKQIKAVHQLQSSKLEKELLSVVNEKQRASNEIELITRNLKEKEEEFESFLSISKGSKCPSCSQPLTDQHKNMLIARYKKAISAKKTEINKQIVLLHKFEKEEQALLKPLDARRAEMYKVESQLHNAQDVYAKHKERYAEAKRKAGEEKSDVNQLKLRKIELIRTLKRLNKILKNASRDKAFLVYSQEAMSRDGLPSFLNKLLCPLLSKAAEYYSELFVDKEIQVVFDVEEGHIVPRIINVNGGNSIKSQSTGEKAWAAIITSFALREIAKPTNLLILDEPGTGLDTASAKKFGERLIKLKDKIETILVVSHNPSIVNALDGDKSITVVKQNGLSSLQLN